MTPAAERPDPHPEGAALERELGRLLPGLSRLELARLVAHIEPVAVARDDAVFRQGDAGHDLYLVLEGTLEAIVASDDGATALPVGRFEAGDAFGEMALFTDAPRSATVRAVDDARLVRLPRARFLELVRINPSIGLMVATRLSERLRTTNEARLLSERAAVVSVEHAIGRLPGDRRARVLDASVLDEPTPEALRALFGPEAAPGAAEDLAALGAGSGAGAGAVLRVLRERARTEAGAGKTDEGATAAARRLVEAGLWGPALGVLARHADRRALANVLGRALRAVPPLPPEQATPWLGRLEDADVLGDVDLTLGRAEWLDAHGRRQAALALLRRALGAALVTQNPGAGQRLTAEVTRLSGADATAAARAGAQFQAHEAQAAPRRSWWTAGCLAATAGLVALAVTGAAPAGRFFYILLAPSPSWQPGWCPTSPWAWAWSPAGCCSVSPRRSRRWPASPPRNGCSSSPSTAWRPPLPRRGCCSGWGSSSCGGCRTAPSGRRPRCAQPGSR